MFRKFLQASSPESRYTAPAEVQIDSPARPPAPGFGERNRNDSFENAKLSSFEDIYHKSSFRAATSTAAWDILKVADMISSEHLHGLSPAGKHSALMMALEAAGVAVEDMLQDAVQRQRVLNDYEETQRRRLEEFEKIKLGDNDRLGEEMEAMCAQYQMRIASARQEIERERATFREWQERKEREQRRISEAASACVSGEVSGSSDASISRLLEKNSGRMRESA
jgi:Skp family chaperone for outer membrane proteins